MPFMMCLRPAEPQLWRRRPSHRVSRARPAALHSDFVCLRGAPATRDSATPPCCPILALPHLPPIPARTHGARREDQSPPATDRPPTCTRPVAGQGLATDSRSTEYRQLRCGPWGCSQRPAFGHPACSNSRALRWRWSHPPKGAPCTLDPPTHAPPHGLRCVARSCFRKYQPARRVRGDPLCLFPPAEIPGPSGGGSGRKERPGVRDRGAPAHGPCWQSWRLPPLTGILEGNRAVSWSSLHPAVREKILRQREFRVEILRLPFWQFWPRAELPLGETLGLQSRAPVRALGNRA